MAALAEQAEPGELRRRPLPEAGALPGIRLLVTRLEQARQRRVDGPREKATVAEERLRLVEGLQSPVRREAAFERPPFLKLPESRRVSRTIVTGPSFSISTCILAPKTPVSTGTPSPRSSSQNRS